MGCFDVFGDERSFGGVKVSATYWGVWSANEVFWPWGERGVWWAKRGV